MRYRADIRLLSLLILLAVVFGGSPACNSDDNDTLTLDQVFEARDLLHTLHVRSPESSDLLGAALRGAVRRAEQVGVQNISDMADVSFAAEPPEWRDSLFWNMFTVLAEESQGKVSEQLLLESALVAMAASLKDGHTGYLPAHVWKLTQDGSHTLQWTPLLNYRRISTGKGSFVWDLQPGSQAELGGLKPGDIVIGFNGVGLSSPDFLKYRPTNTFTVERPGVGRLDFKVKLEPESMRPFEARMIGDLAYLELYVFPPLEWRSGNETFRDNLESELRSLARLNPRGWILDLRDNDGGSVDTLALVVSAFGENGRFFDAQAKGYALRPVFGGEWGTPGNLRQDAPMVVLVDRNTVSAGEILAFALQDRQGAHLIGTRTRGSVQGARSVPLSRGGGLHISASENWVGYDTNFMTNLEGVGVTPDEELALDLDGILRGVDNQLQRAIDYLNGLNGGAPKP